MPNPWFRSLLCFSKSSLEITTKSMEQKKGHSPGKGNGVFNCIKDGRCKEQRRFSYRLKINNIKNWFLEIVTTKHRETHPTHYGESRPLPLARGNVITSDEQSRMTTSRESDFLINQEYDYRQNWTTRGPMKDEL